METSQTTQSMPKEEEEMEEEEEEVVDSNPSQQPPTPNPLHQQPPAPNPLHQQPPAPNPLHQQPPAPLPWPNRPPGHGVFHPGGVVPPMGLPPHPGVFPGQQQIPQMSFGGGGHRLGGKEIPMKFGDPQVMSKHVSDSARTAAERRAKMLSKMSSEDKVYRTISPSFPSLEVLCYRCLSRWSSVNYLPSCSHLPPRVAQRLIVALADSKQLHPKTLNVFIKCPLQMLVLDNYTYATNQLLDMFRYFPTLNHLSLVSCTLITDKSMTQLLPYLSNLVHLNLNGCYQLSDVIFHSFTGYRQLREIKLSQLKFTDTGMKLLLRHPLECLKELDLSYTGITALALTLLPQGVPGLESLNIEATKVSDVTPLLTLEHLRTLNIAQCPLEGRVGTLAGCCNLASLSLSNIPVDCTELMELSKLKLASLILPDRNMFFDEHMEVISVFPLTELNLTGYCNVTDVGIQYVSRMITLTRLSLSRTKLTDEGMMYLQDLTNLKQLSLDNTLITDQGMICVKGLENLEDLSVSDTKLTSEFILIGGLDNMKKLAKLNLVRTFVDDEGLSSLSIPSLMMLSIDWTCTTEDITIETLRRAGCRSLETFRNRNIRQPSPAQLQQQQQQQQQQIHGIQGRVQPILPNPQPDDDDSDDSEED